MLRDKLATVPESLPTPDDSGTNTLKKRIRIASPTTDDQIVPNFGTPLGRSTCLRQGRNAAATDA